MTTWNKLNTGTTNTHKEDNDMIKVSTPTIITAVRPVTDDGAITKPFLDLEMCFFWKQGNDLRLITSENCDLTADELEAQAEREYTCYPLALLLGLKDYSPLWVVTPSEGAPMYGAGVMTDMDALHRVAAATGSKSVYIIPSSIHEVLLLPSSVCSVDELEAIIRSVNSSHVEPEERLADHPYIYDVKTRQLMIA